MYSINIMFINACFDIILHSPIHKPMIKTIFKILLYVKCKKENVYLYQSFMINMLIFETRYKILNAQLV